MPGLRRFVLLASLITVALSACRHASDVPPDHPRIADGVAARDVKFYSAVLGREMPYRVFLPASLPAGRKLPVVYLLHGAGQDFRSWSNDSNVSAYARNGWILVMAEGGLSYFMNEAGRPGEKYEDFITKDLIADVESRFPAAAGRTNRGIVGISMGGFAAIDYALTRPDLYVFCGALSPPVDAPSRHFSFKYIGEWWRFHHVFGPMGSKERRARDPFVLVQTANPRVTPYLYVTNGENEALAGPVRKFAGLLAQRGFAYELHTKPGGHDWGEWNEQIPDCFAALAQRLSAAAN